MRATTPSKIKGSNSIVMRAMMPAWQWQGRLRIDNGNYAIVMRASITIVTMAKMPAHWWQRHHHDEGNNASLMMSKKGNIASLTTAKMPMHWQQQQRHHDESNNCHCENGEDAYVLMATMPWWWGWGHQLDDKQQGQQHQWWWQCHCNNDYNTSLRTKTTPSQQGQQCCHGSRATTPLLQGWQHQLDNSKDACVLTMAMMPLSWGWQLQLWHWQRCLRIDRDNTIMTRATMPAWWKATRATMLVWQQWRWCGAHLRGSKSNTLTSS